MLGFFLRSMHQPQTYFTFEDTLTQIGLGYVFLFLLGFVVKEKWLWIALGAILFGLLAGLGAVSRCGPRIRLAGGGRVLPIGLITTAVSWRIGTRTPISGTRFDQWFLNLFPRTSPFVANEGGYLTLSFIPTLGTMILGLIAGRWLRAAAPQIPFRRLLIAGVAGLARVAAARSGYLPGGETHLDSELDDFQRRNLFPDAGGVLMDH